MVLVFETASDILADGRRDGRLRIFQMKDEWMDRSRERMMQGSGKDEVVG